MINFEAFEKDVITTLLDASDSKYKSQLFEQYQASSIIKRKFTGVGFFSEFFVPDKTLYLPNDVKFELGNIHAEVNDLRNGAGFILFIREGVINLLEGYSYGDDGWPENITGYKFFLVNAGGSLTDLYYRKPDSNPHI